MTMPSINISNKIDPTVVALYEIIARAARQLHIPYMVIGASARDMVLHYGYNAPIQRATTDVDFGMQVADWNSFAQLKLNLLSADFKETRQQHRLISPQNIPIDIVPFGGLASQQARIQWPPDGETIMSVLGFHEAIDHAHLVRIQDNPPIDIPVASPEGLTLLKLIAWIDRTLDKRKKDAKDLGYLLSNYEKIPSVSDLLYENTTLMEQYAWDLTRASSHQLGAAIKQIASPQTYLVISTLFTMQNHQLSLEKLIEEMCDNINQQYQYNEQLLTAFISGFEPA